MELKNGKLLKAPEVLTNEVVLKPRHVLCTWWHWGQTIKHSWLKSVGKDPLALLTQPVIPCIMPYILIVSEEVCMQDLNWSISMNVNTWQWRFRYLCGQSPWITYLWSQGEGCNECQLRHQSGHMSLAVAEATPTTLFQSHLSTFPLPLLYVWYPCLFPSGSWLSPKAA